MGRNYMKPPISIATSFVRYMLGLRHFLFMFSRYNTRANHFNSRNGITGKDHRRNFLCYKTYSAIISRGRSNGSSNGDNNCVDDEPWNVAWLGP